MINHNIPVGAHTVKSVSYDTLYNSTKLTLDCGHTALMSILYTEQYKPEAGDYWIVTEHGTQCLIKKNVFDAATKPMGLFVDKRTVQYAVDSMFSVPLLRPEDISQMLIKASAIDLLGMKNDKPTITGSATAKPETMGMREENGWVGVDRAASGVLGTERQGSGTVGYKQDTEYGTKGQNVIKSLTGQNEAKQKKINDLVRQVRTQAESIQHYGSTIDLHKKQVQSLRDQIAIQATDGNWDVDEYMRGMLNGLLCALSNFDGVAPEYKEALPANPVRIVRPGVITATKGHVDIQDFTFEVHGPHTPEQFKKAVVEWVDQQFSGKQ